jgi:putative flippase GtrA
MHVPMAGFMAKHQIKLRFLMVGIWNTVFGYLVFIGFDSLFAPLFSQRYVAYMSAAVLSNVLAIINAYIFHKYITFKSRIKGIGVLFEFLKFSTTYLITFCLSLLILPLFVEVLNVTPKIAGGLVIICCTVISYVGHSKFSFRD